MDNRPAVLETFRTFRPGLPSRPYCSRLPTRNSCVGAAARDLHAYSFFWLACFDLTFCELDRCIDPIFTQNSYVVSSPSGTMDACSSATAGSSLLVPADDDAILGAPEAKDVVGGVILAGIFIDASKPLAAYQQGLWLTHGIIIAVLVAFMLITIFSVRERNGATAPVGTRNS